MLRQPLLEKAMPTKRYYFWSAFVDTIFSKLAVLTSVVVWAFLTMIHGTDEIGLGTLLFLHVGGCGLNSLVEMYLRNR